MADQRFMPVDELVRLLDQTQDLPLRHRSGFAARLVGTAVRSAPGPMLRLLGHDYPAPRSGLGLTQIGWPTDRPFPDTP
jgi:hypothetical protein